MTIPERQWLIESLRDVLLPAMLDAGFVQLPLAGEDARSTEIRTAFPFGRLRRECDGGFEQLEIQLDKRKRPAFRISFGVVPREGIVHAVGPVKQEDVWVQYLSRYNELYQWPRLRSWFAVRHWPGTPASKSDYRALAAQVAALIPEIESAFDGSKSLPWTSHVRRVRA